jgi:hypothetical protein
LACLAPAATGHKVDPVTCTVDADIPITRAIGAVAAKFDRIGGVPGSVIGEADVFYHGFSWEDNYAVVIGS